MHQPVDRAPRDLWVPAGTEAACGDEVAELLFRYPNDIILPDMRSARRGPVHWLAQTQAEYTDAWGCTLRIVEPGAPEEVVRAPLTDLGRLASFKPPWELATRGDAGVINRACAATPRFVLAWTEARPLDRLGFLHGREAALTALASAAKPILQLLSMIHELCVQDVQWWAATDVDGAVLRDDWALPCGTSLSVEVWRSVLKPLYRQYCEILRQRDKFVFFHSASPVAEVLDELIEIGVDAVHAPWPGPDLDAIGTRYAGRVTFWNGIDSPRTLAEGTTEEVRAGVRRVRRALDRGSGGLIAQLLWAPNVRFENVCAAMEQLQAVLASRAEPSPPQPSAKKKA